MRERLHLYYWNIRIRIRERRFIWMEWYSLQMLKLGMALIARAEAYRYRHKLMPIIQNADRYSPATIESRY